MAIFRVQVNYTKGSVGKWSNVWHVDTTDIATAAAQWLAQAVPDLTPILDNTCLIASFLVSDLVGSQFVTQPVNLPGTSSASGDLLPLFNSLKALFSDGSLGRPDYKYFKGFVTESIQTDGLLASGTITAVAALLDTLIADCDTAGIPLVSIQGDPYIASSIQPAVQMRQMHRKRRRTP